MNKNIFRLVLAVTIILPLIYFGCADFPSKLVLPTWNVDLNVPVFNRNYTLQDAINKDSSIIKSYNDPARMGLLYYSTSKGIDAVTVKNSLTFDPISSSASVKLDSIKIDYPAPVGATVYARDLDNSLQPNTSVIFPPVNNVPVSKQLDRITQFESALFGYAIIKITIRNVMPVDASVTGMVVKNKNNGEQIFPSDDSTYSTGRINPGSSVSHIYTLKGKTIQQDLVLSAFISSPGSGGNPVTITDSTGIRATAELIGYSISSAVAHIPPQPPFKFQGEFDIDDSTSVQKAVFKDGALSINFINNFDLDLKATIVIHNMYDPNGNEFSLPVQLLKKGQKTVNISSLAGYSFVASGNSPINKLPYDVTVVTDSSTGAITVSKQDSVLAVATVSGIIIKEFTGRIKPTHIDVDQSSFSLGLGDIKDKFSFGQLNITDANVNIHLSQSAAIEFGYSGTITGKTKTQTRNMSIPYTVLNPGSNTIALDPATFQNFLNGFTGTLPDSLIVQGNGTANPNYKTGSVASSDSIYGSAEIELPLKLGIGAGSFSDTTDLDISRDVRDKKDQVSKLTVTMELGNGLPAGISATTKLYDEFGNFLMNLPPDRAPNNKSISVPAATIDANGKVTGTSSAKINVDLNQSEIDKFLRAKKIVLDISFNTAGTNNQGVEFKTSDAVSLKAYGSVTYKVK